MNNSKEVLILLPLGLLAAAAAAPAAGPPAAVAALPVPGAKTARADSTEIAPGRYYGKALAFRDGEKMGKDPGKACESSVAPAKKGRAGAQ